MKSMKVIHRDLKLGNLLLNENMDVKVCDFGLAAKVTFDGEKRRTICGTPNYIAPEVLSSKIGHSFEVDLWSLGVIAYTMMFGRPPFETRDVKVTYRKIRHNNYTFPTHVQISDSGKDFVRSLLRTDPHKRLDLDKIMAHDFFAMDYPERLPLSMLAGPPSAAFCSRYEKMPDEPPKPGVSPGKAPIAKDVATFECDLVDNDEAQIMSNRLASVETHRRIESQDKFIHKVRGKETISNDRDNFKTASGLYFHQGLGKDVEGSPYCSPAKKGANYLQINLAKYNDDKEDSKAEYLKCKQYRKPHNAWTAQNSDKKLLETEPNDMPILPTETDNVVLNTEAVESKKPLPEVRIRNRKASPEADEAKSKSRISHSKAPKHSDKILISKWIDYTSKYGVGYKLSDGSYGVLFNDSTKLVVAKDNYQFYYLTREHPKHSQNGVKVDIYNFNTYPNELKKKVVLTQHFISYLMGVKFVASKQKPDNFDQEFAYNEDDIYLKKFATENKAVLLRLNNKMIQVIFLDHSELILSSDSGDVMFITSKGQVRQSIISSDLKTYSSLERSDPSMYKRLNYAKEMLLNLISKQKPNKNKYPLFQTKSNSDTKENNVRFSRKASNISEKRIEFYATQRLETDYGMTKTDLQSSNCEKIENIAAGAAAEIRKKLANYNSVKTDFSKPDLLKSQSLKTTASST